MAPAPIGNTNALRHGLAGGALPPGCSYVQRQVSTFRQSLEADVMQAHGEITVTRAALINSALRWERHAQLAQRWLKVEFANLSAADRLSYSRDIAKASDARDKCIAALDLNRDVQADLWATLDATPSTPAPALPNAADDATEPQTGDSGHEGAA